MTLEPETRELIEKAALSYASKQRHTGTFKECFQAGAEFMAEKLEQQLSDWKRTNWYPSEFLTLEKERYALKSQLSEFQELHDKTRCLIIPGETDSVDAYRKLYFEMKSQLQESERVRGIYRKGLAFYAEIGGRRAREVLAVGEGK